MKDHAIEIVEKSSKSADVAEKLNKVGKVDEKTKDDKSVKC